MRDCKFFPRDVEVGLQKQLPVEGKTKIGTQRIYNVRSNQFLGGEIEVLYLARAGPYKRTQGEYNTLFVIRTSYFWAEAECSKLFWGF